MAGKQAQRQKLLDRVESVLKQVDRSFLTIYDPKVLGDVHNLPDAIWAIEHLRGRRRRPVPFWDCVQRVDADWPELKLIERLDKMLDRAFKILWPSPWVSLRARFKTSAYRDERALAEKLIEHYNNTGSQPPENLESYWELFMGLDLMHLGPMGTSIKLGAWSIEAKRIFSYACYLSLCCTSMEWEENMREILGQLEDLLGQLEGERLSQRFNAFLSEDRLPTNDQLKQWHQKALNRSRVRHHRNP